MLRILSYSVEKGFMEPGLSDIPDLLKEEKRITWVDFDNPSEEEAKILTEVFNFHPLAVEDCLSFVPNPKIDDYGDYIYMIIHGINAEALKRDELETHDLDIFLGPNYLVTFHKGFFRSITEVMERCRKNTAIMSKDPESLMHKIIDTLVDNYLPIMDALGDEIEETEKEVFEKPARQATPKKLLLLKKDIMYLRRVVHPQREILRELGSGGYKQICPECRPHFKDVYDHIFMVSQLIESYTDSISSAMEVYLSLASNRLNEILKVLTVIATIMMPLTVLTGVYGMNFVHMPLIESPYGFPLILALMFLIGLGMLAYFKRKGWW
ncbi:MAG: magnesium/cobalt transporter CorA [Deltaproteobacteria bacterium]|nr:magnesium/cobalt transporter CorA [Deltaproteobacteria bacterium]